MTHRLSFLLLFALLISCNTLLKKGDGDAVLINQQITSHTGDPILVGLSNREGFQAEPYKVWFNESYQNYEVDAATLEEIKKKISDIEIMLFMGTWCSDSQREVPRFYKILDYLKFKEKKLKVINLDNHPDQRKTSPQGEEVGMNIEYVPTFIVFKDGQEKGRIIEHPIESLEKDLVGIVK